MATARNGSRVIGAKYGRGLNVERIGNLPDGLSLLVEEREITYTSHIVIKAFNFARTRAAISLGTALPA